MEHYISKAAIVALLREKAKESRKNATTAHDNNNLPVAAVWSGKENLCLELIELLDTLEYVNLEEVKEKAKQDLAATINDLSERYPEVSFAKVSRIAARIAKWQQEQDEPTSFDRGMAEEIITHLKRVEEDYRLSLTDEIQWLRNIAKKGE